MKKNLLITALVALVLASCGKVETYVPDTLMEDAPIDFSWYTNRSMGSSSSAPATKASSTYFVDSGSGHLNSGTSMGVFGYFHPQASSTVAGTWNTTAGAYNAPNLFYNEKVSIEEDGGVYTYDYTNSRFWPKNKLDRISFIAYYPWNELNTSGAATDATIVEPFLDVNSERGGMVGFYYVVPAKSEDQVDFMVSDLCLEQSKAVWNDDNSKGLTGNANGKVKFFFHHALSQVRVKSVAFNDGDNDDVELKINYIVFKNVAVFGQCIPVPNFGAADATGRVPVTPTWPSGTLVPKRPDYTSGVTADVCYNSSTGAWDVNKFLLMIPHTFFKDATIEVNFDVTRKKDPVTGEYYSYTGNTLSAPLTTTSVYEWQAGKIYTYNITLDLKQIKVTADVVDWLDAGEDILMDH
ncbi:MAG: fimbrillin family protein [Bacteroidales bacterium]|nr:fimbrillin family protein [Bacteroidales bacterium]